MALPFKPEAVSKKILSSLTKIIGDDVRDHVQFAEEQTKLLAKQAALIAQAAISGDIDADDRDFFTESLRASAENFARTLVALTILTIEKAWNALVSILWGAINKAIESAGLPISFPIPGAPAA
ncbi:hypothetical protein ACFFTN_04470 [Aminobacter aganoensis]|uniref:Uncharacterized protein n=1 Tax=Aminobacter aganoensis TaxID=83264 RepID=A0A7X0F6U6_9HYPH|nr:MULTISPECIES: hypothetical protein [Aminobacter]KQU64213.1 hypothetical protein ASC75_13750 [Aminobacter sp. DSM 101952]MBB6354247.1 hypothetical protein [Aminobacter aganoensis]